MIRTEKDESLPQILIHMKSSCMCSYAVAKQTRVARVSVDDDSGGEAEIVSSITYLVINYFLWRIQILVI